MRAVAAIALTFPSHIYKICLPMTNAEVTKALPPILLAFGGLIPILILSGQETFSKEDRALGGTVFVLLTWIAYLLAGILWGVSYYDLFLVLALLTIATFLLIALLVMRRLPASPPTSAKKFFHRLVNGLRSKLGTPLVYLVAVSILALASAVYVNPTGHDILHLTNIPYSDLKSVNGLFKGDTANTANQPLPTITRFGNTSVILSKDKFKELEQISITFYKHATFEQINPGQATPMVGPYLGNQYVLQVPSQN